VDFGLARQVGRRRVPIYVYELMDFSYASLPEKEICPGRAAYNDAHACHVLADAHRPWQMWKESNRTRDCHVNDMSACGCKMLETAVHDVEMTQLSILAKC
jgi:hypothetical protein